MYHFYDVVINDSTGVPLSGVIIRIYTKAGVLVPLFADEAGTTPIEAVSGISDAAVTDGDGNYDFYIADGKYDMRFFQGDAVLKVLNNIQMVEAASDLDVKGKAQAAALGVSGSDTNLGTTPGAILSDNGTAKQWFQESEAAIEGREIAAFSQAGSYTPGTVRKKLQQTVYLEDFGAIGDGVTDDSAAFAAAVAFLSAGGVIRGKHGQRYYLASPPTITKGITLQGESWPFKPRTEWDLVDLHPSVILLPSTQTINLDSAALDGWLLWMKDIAVPTTEAAFYTELAKFAGTAVAATGDDARVSNCLAIGFHKFVYANNVFRPEFFHNIFDCNNGIEITQVYDFRSRGVFGNLGQGFLNQYRAWPWATTRRPGTAIYAHDGVDFVRVWNNNSYGYAKGLHLKDVASVKASHIADGPGLHDPSAATGTVGIHLEGNLQGCLIDSCHVDGQETGYLIRTTTNPVQLGTNSCGTATLYQIDLGAGSLGTIDSMALNGPCVSPIKVGSGVSRWQGLIYCNSSISGSGIWDTADPDKEYVMGLRVIQASYTRTDAVANGFATAPAVVANPAYKAGLYNTSSTALGIAANGKLTFELAAEDASVNWLRFTGQNNGGSAYLEAVSTNPDGHLYVVAQGAGALRLCAAGNKLGFFAGEGALKQTVTGAKGGNAALASLITALAAYGIITDSTT